MYRRSFVHCVSIASLPLLTLPPSVSTAHHSTRGVYDHDRITELRGHVVEVTWRNPHVRFKVEGQTADGHEALWDIEGPSVAFMERSGLSADALQPGDAIMVAGNAAIRGTPAMYFTNVLLQDGREVLSSASASPRWEDQPVVLANWTFSPEEVAAAVRDARGLFRVWSRSVASGSGLWNREYPLTDAARAAQAAWDPVNSPYVSCVKGMPSIMEQPYPIEFVDEGDEILLYIEEYDVVRTIEMNPDASVEDRTPATWGHSVGHWEGETLVVMTTGISWEYFDQTGVPLTENAVLQERFTPADDGYRLDYQLTVDEPLSFTEPVVLEKQWRWVPGEQVKPFDCVAHEVAGSQ